MMCRSFLIIKVAVMLAGLHFLLLAGKRVVNKKVSAIPVAG